jgi:hypothetical protein
MASVSPAVRAKASSNTSQHALVFVSLFLPFTYFNHNDGWNQGARLAELHSLVLHRSLNIDRYHELTGDKALINGHYYSEKAPAIVLMALPAFALTVVGQTALGVDPDSERGWRVSEWIATAGSVGVVAAMGGVAFFALLKRKLNATAALIATFGLFLGSLTFPYATSLFAHAGTIGLLSLALWGVLETASARRDYFAGICAGLAVASEYPAIISCATIALYLAWTAPQRALRFAVALLPAVVLILANNFLITGSPLRASYGSNPAFPAITAAHLFGFGLPDGRVIGQLLWGEYRGLFFWSPVLLMALPGLVVLTASDRPLAAMIVAGSSLTLLQVASFYSWFGGNAVGPRYLAPALPFLGLSAAFGIRRFPKTGALLALVSVLLMGMVAAIAIDPPQDVMTPFESFYLARVIDNRFADSLGTLLGWPPLASLFVPIATLVVTSVWVIGCARASAGVRG